ncbi:hypothetical protein QT397_07830 [Microbulbifer sp. MKSA007]|nr:hypothetical protein QT397_07830 [Microbulbifer sp. MKSA007]
MNTFIFLASATSGTGSMIRIFSEMAGFNVADSKYVDKFILEGKLSELKKSIVPMDGGFHVFNRPIDFNTLMDFSKYQFLVNFRDPRDRLCNMFHWTQSHPAPGVCKDELQKRRERIAEQGIDSWVLQQSLSEASYYENFWRVLEGSLENSIVLSYAELCMDFDSFIRRSSEFIGTTLSIDLLDKLEVERPENISLNKKWVGNKWSGSDVMPGRYLKELSPDTINKLNKSLADVLKNMAHFDPKYSELYLKGID